ncbi:MAG: GTP 3',8-cyclase MoaA, partial [Bacilli bacterium]
KNEILDILQNHFQLSPTPSTNHHGVATRYLYKDTTCEVGIISSITEAFCGTCTRGRISANGQFYTCLFANKGYDLKSELRKIQNDADLETLITSIWSERMDRYSEERLQLLAKKAPQKKIEMSYIGG